MGLGLILPRRLKLWNVLTINFGKWPCLISRTWWLDHKSNVLNYGDVTSGSSLKGLWNLSQTRTMFASQNSAISSIDHGLRIFGKFGWKIGPVKLLRDMIVYIYKALTFITGSEVLLLAVIQLVLLWATLLGVCVMLITTYNSSEYKILGESNGGILVRLWLQGMMS